MKIVCPMCFGTISNDQLGCGHDRNCVYWDTTPNDVAMPSDELDEAAQEIVDGVRAKRKDRNSDDDYDRAMKGI